MFLERTVGERHEIERHIAVPILDNHVLDVQKWQVHTGIAQFLSHKSSILDHFDQVLDFQGPKPKFKVLKVFEVCWEASLMRTEQKAWL